MNTTRPLISEKSMTLAQKGWYSFVVSDKKRKEEIVKEIQGLYSVNVIDVRTSMRHGKMRRNGKKMMTAARPNWKRAMVRLKKGQTISIFDIGDATQKQA